MIQRIVRRSGQSCMKTLAELVEAARGRAWWLMVAVLLHTSGAHAALEDKFDVLQIGATTYQNVTVTTKNKSYVFLLHSKGMTNIKVADLPSEVRLKLGYEDPATHVKTNTPAVWAKNTLAKVETPEIKKLETQVSSFWRGAPALSGVNLPPINRNTLLIAGLSFLALYLFHCYCCSLICKKSGSEPGPLVWVPVFQLFPLLKAATMSPWWFLGFLVPGLNLIAQILWCVKITQARGKAFIVALLLMFPLSSPFAALFLAFSGGKHERKAPRRVAIMTLETA
jgi:hypothetical protein